MDKVIYKGKEYYTREIPVPTFGIRTIGTESLEDAVMSEYSGNPEAQRVDNSIFFYVPDGMIGDSELKLSRYVYEQVA